MAVDSIIPHQRVQQRAKTVNVVEMMENIIDNGWRTQLLQQQSAVRSRPYQREYLMRHFEQLIFTLSSVVPAFRIHSHFCRVRSALPTISDATHPNRRRGCSRPVGLHRGPAGVAARPVLGRDVIAWCGLSIFRMWADSVGRFNAQRWRWLRETIYYHSIDYCKL